MIQVFGFGLWPAIAAGGLFFGLLLVVLFTGRSWGAAVRIQVVATRIAVKDARIAELEAAVAREEVAAEDAADRARSATAQALATTTTLREAAQRFADQVDREINKTIAAANQPTARGRARKRGAA